MNIPDYCDLDCSPSWFHGNIDRKEAEIRLFSKAKYLGYYGDRLFLIREKSKGKSYVVSLYLYYTGCFQHHLFEKYSWGFLVNNSLVIYETCLSKLVNDLCTFTEIGEKINGNKIPLCNIICEYKKNYNLGKFTKPLQYNNS